MSVTHILSIYTALNTKLIGENRNISVIRSNLMHKCLLLAEEENSPIDIRSMCCQWCLNPLTPQSCNVILKPQKRPKKHLRSLLKKDPNSLNSFQLKLVGKIKSKPVTNKMLFNCKFCSKTTTMPLKKPMNELQNENDEVTVVEDIGRKKKKKKKDVYAGLNVAAVHSVKNASVNSGKKLLNDARTYSKKFAKKISRKEQTRMQKVLSQTPAPMRKPSLLAAFLDNM